MTFKNYKSLKIGDWNFKKLIRASDGLVLFEKYSKPYDAEIAYLETTGQQYIDTGIFPSLDMEFNTKIYTPRVGDDYFCSLRKDGGNTRYYLLNYNSSAGYVCTKSSWPCAAKKPNYFSTNTHIIKSKITQDKVSIEVDGSYVEYADKGGLFSPDKTLPLFGAKLNSTTINARSNVGTRCYYAKFISNGQVVGDFIPVRVGNVGYMYDKVSGKLFGNLGAGNFILGPDIVENPYVTDGLVNMFDALLVPNWQDVIGNALMTGTSATEGYTNLGYQIAGVNWPELYKGAFTIQIAFNQTAINGNWYSLLENKGTRSGYYSLDVRIAWTKSLSTYAIGCRAKQASSSNLPITGFEKGTPFYGTITISAPASGRGTYTFNDNQPVSYAITGNADYTPASDVITSSSGYYKNKTRVYGIRIYNRALTKDEIAANYAIDKQRFNI